MQMPPRQYATARSMLPNCPMCSTPVCTREAELYIDHLTVARDEVCVDNARPKVGHCAVRVCGLRLASMVRQRTTRKKRLGANPGKRIQMGMISTCLYRFEYGAYLRACTIFAHEYVYVFHPFRRGFILAMALVTAGATGS